MYQRGALRVSHSACNFCAVSFPAFHERVSFPLFGQTANSRHSHPTGICSPLQASLVSLRPPEEGGGEEQSQLVQHLASIQASCWPNLQVSKLLMTLKGTKPAPESVEGLAVQAEALQHLAAVVLACAQHLKVAYPLKAPTAVGPTVLIQCRLLHVPPCRTHSEKLYSAHRGSEACFHALCTAVSHHVGECAYAHTP